MNEPSSSRHKKEKKGSDDDSSDEGGFCFAFPGQEDSPRKPIRKRLEKVPERNGDTKEVGCYSDKYNERLLDWGGGWDWEADESGVESIADGKRSGWGSQREKEEFNKYLEELLEKEDFEKLKQQEEEIQNLKKEIEKYKKTDDNSSTENKGEKKKRRPKKSRSIEREKKTKQKVHLRKKSESDKSSPPIEKREAIELSEKEKALLEYKKAIAAKYARIRTDVKDHRSQMILDYYSDRLSRRLATNQVNAGAGDHVPEPPPEKVPEGIVPPLKLNRLPNAKEPLNKPTKSSDDVSHSMRRSKLASEAYKRRSMQYGSELDASYIYSHPTTSSYRRSRANTTFHVSLSPRDPGATESLRIIPISFQEKKEEEKRYCVVLGDRFCGKTSLLDAVCVPRASREKYDKDLRKAMKGSWFKRGNSLKKSGNLRKKDHTIRFEDSNGKMRTLVFFDIPETGPDAEAKRKDAIEKADICLLCYPIDDDSALDRLKEQWIPKIQKVEPPLPIVLVGTRADMRLNSVSKVSGGGSKSKASKEEPVDDGDLDEFKGLRLSQQLQLNGYVECSILFRKTLDRFLQYVSSVISEAETSMGGG